LAYLAPLPQEFHWCRKGGRHQQLQASDQLQDAQDTEQVIRLHGTTRLHALQRALGDARLQGRLRLGQSHRDATAGEALPQLAQDGVVGQAWRDPHIRPQSNRILFAYFNDISALFSINLPFLTIYFFLLFAVLVVLFQFTGSFRHLLRVQSAYTSQHSAQVGAHQVHQPTL
jgi:hypothetical protein